MELNPEIASAFMAACRRGGPPGARELLRDLRRMPLRSCTNSCRKSRDTLQICDECAESHTPARRQARLRRLGTPTASEVRERLDWLADHLWPRTEAGQRKLLRDLAAVRGYPKRSTDGAAERLAKALELLDAGVTLTRACGLAHVNKPRASAYLRASGMRYRNAFRPELRGWVAA